MKKFGILIVVVIATTFLISKGYRNDESKTSVIEESRGIFISYIEYMSYFTNLDNNKLDQKIEEMINIISNNHFNRVYLQVRPFSDSIYSSNIFPFSHTISGTQGKSINYDVLEAFINKCRFKNIEIYAWINPYRISNYTDTSFLSLDNPAYSWLNTNKVKIIDNKGIYYNPASREVRELIIDGVKELIKNYNINGILLDDYFYPNDQTIDQEEYDEVKDIISLAEFRYSQVNELISGIYKAIKDYDSNIKFGISPDGNIENNSKIHYADIKTWLEKDGYIDFIMPQIYYGFYHETKPFINTINEWSKLNSKNKELLVALALYKSGIEDIYAKSGKSEWINHNNMIERQIKVSRNITNYKGYSLFRYDYLINTENNINLKEEIKNYNKLF